MNTKELVLKYFNSWQQPADFNAMASCLSEHLKVNSGFFKFDSRENFIHFLKANPAPWKGVKLLSSFFHEEDASILYEGINTGMNRKMRVSEHISISEGKIIDIQTVIAQLD